MTELKQSINQFISYASEDLNPFVQPLVMKLTSVGIKVWCDKFCLKPGDSIREKIDFGLRESYYGIIVLSPAFIKKRFPIKELNALFNLEIEGSKVILPIWRNLTKKDVLDFSPFLADKFAIMADEGIEAVTQELLLVIDPEKTALCEKVISEWSKLERAGSLFLKERPILNRPRIITGDQAISDLIAEGYVKNEIANKIINIRETYYRVYHKQNNFQDYVDIELIEKLR